MKRNSNSFAFAGKVALMGTVIVAGATLNSCDKDEVGVGVDLNNPQSLTQFSPRVRSGLYGDVKTSVTTEYDFSDAVGAYTLNGDSTDFTITDLSKAKKSYESTTEYNQAGYITLRSSVSYDTDGTTKRYENKTVYTLDSKNRTLTENYTYFSRSQWTNGDGEIIIDTYNDTRNSVYTYDDAAKTATCIITTTSARGEETTETSRKTVYRLDDNGNIDSGNYEDYSPVRATAFEPTPSTVYKTVKDGQGNVAETKRINKQPGYVNILYSKTTYTYY